MDSVAIANIITHKKGVTSLEVSELKFLADSYPYAQVFTIFYLKALAETKNLAFDTELNKYAYRVTDRVKLYEIIHAKEELSTINSQEITEKITTPEISDVQQEEHEVVILELDTAEEPFVEVKEETVIEPVEEIPTNDEVAPVAEINITEETNESVTIDEVEPEIAQEDAMDTLERSILSNAIDTAFSHILKSESVAKEKEELELVEDEEELAEEISTNEIETSTNNDDIETSLHTFSGWLTKGKIASSISNEEDTIAKNESEKQAEDKKGALIDRFIEKKPTISRPKKEFFSAPKKAQESVDDSSLLYSETLASIYVIQGNFPLAIKAYEQLSLTIPEKRMIFAEKIEELKIRLQNLK